MDNNKIKKEPAADEQMLVVGEVPPEQVPEPNQNPELKPAVASNLNKSASSKPAVEPNKQDVEMKVEQSPPRPAEKPQSNK